MAEAGASELTAAPSEFRIGDKTILLHPLRFRNWGEIERWIRDDIIGRAKRAIADNTLTQQQRIAIMTAAFREADDVNVMDALLVGHTYLNTFEGMLRIICQSAAIGQTDVKSRLTIDDFDCLFAGDANLMMKAFLLVRDISFPAMFLKERETGPNPTPAAPEAPQCR